MNIQNIQHKLNVYPTVHDISEPRRRKHKWLAFLRSRIKLSSGGYPETLILIGSRGIR
jgi:hypothetical protein